MILFLILQLALPNVKLTPGVSVNIKQENLCPETQVLKLMPGITEALRDKILLNYKLLGNGQSYHIDILIPLELGGSLVIKNMWPIPYETRRDTLVQKVALEHKLHDLICSGDITLKQAQKEISTNWVDSYQKRVIQ